MLAAAPNSEIEARREAWIGLSLLPNWGPVSIWQAVGRSKNPLPVWQRFHTLFPAQPVAEALAVAAKSGIDVITYDEAGYPCNLRTAPAPPPVLYVKGTLLPQDAAAVAIVGSRRASAQALQMAKELGRELAQKGITVVSGLAIGVDTYAHEGALEGGGTTIAVLGCGADIVYPQRNRQLAARISQSGALVSEFACGMPPRAGHFPVRNKTIAGLALGTVVVEAGERSGALITAHLTQDCSRKLFACPADPKREHALGSNRLLQMTGVRLVLNVDDILNVLEPELKTCWQRNTVAPAHTDFVTFKSAVQPAQRPLAENLWHILAEGPSHIDEIALRVGTPCSAVRSCLAQLAAADRVICHPGDLYSLC